MSYPRDLELERTSPADKHASAERTEPVAAASPEVRSDRRVDLVAWLFVIALLLVQFGMFRQFALREVVWSYPPNHDQLSYLDQSYTGYEQIIQDPSKGLEGLVRFLPPPQHAAPKDSVVLPREDWHVESDWQRSKAAGMMLPLQAALLFCMAGPGRLTALSLNFLYFALLQVALVTTVKWLTGRWSVALLALGLLLLAKAPFPPSWAGGLFDLRLDFIAFCLYGIVVCLAMRSRVFADRTWSLVAGAAGALLFTFRFLTLTYLAGVLGCVMAFLLVRLWSRRHDPEARRRIARQFGNALLASAIIAAVALPMLIPRLHAIEGYYVVGHLTGPEKNVRAAEQGITDLRSALLFYPRSLYDSGLGRPLLRAVRWVLLASIGLLAFRLIAHGRTSTGTFDPKASVFLVMAAILVPFTALTVDTAKSPVVGDIMVVPALWAVLLCVMTCAAAYRGARLSPVVRWVLIGMAAVVLGRAMIELTDQYARRASMTRHRDEVDRVLEIHRRLASTVADLGLTAPRFAFDSMSDVLHYKVFKILTYERNGTLLDADEVLANSIFERDPDEAVRRLRFADFVVLTRHPSPRPGAFELPFDRRMRELRPRLFDWCRNNDVELFDEHLGAPFNCEVTAFARPEVRVQADADGWMASRGAKIVGLAEVLRRRPRVDLWGPNTAQYLKDPPHVTARIAAGEARAALKYEGDRYHLSLHLDPVRLPPTGRVEIELTFDRSFVPRQINGSADDRELVMPLPDRASLLPEDDAALGQVVGGKLNLDAVAGKDADEVLAHFPRHDPQDFVVGIVQPQLEHRVGQRGGDGRFDFDRLGFGHSASPLDDRRFRQAPDPPNGRKADDTAELERLQGRCR